MGTVFEIQGHRGARGVKPENTLPSFEAALDAGVTSIETDVHLTRDGVPVLVHDPILSPRLFETVPAQSQELLNQPLLISGLTLEQLRGYRAVRNPDPARFPLQTRDLPPLVKRFAAQTGLDPYTPPTVAEFIEFVGAYASAPGRAVGKSDWQRQRAAYVRFDFELKRVPFRPQLIGDDYDGTRPALLETSLIGILHNTGVVARTTVRSFDHRCVRMIGALEPVLTTAVLCAGTAPVDPVHVVLAAGASMYCPDFEFLDRRQILQCHEAGIRVLPWTINHREDWELLLEWGVDGITTDYPDQLVCWLRERGRVD